MSIRPVTYYQITCDAEGCKVDTSHLGDYSAWGEPGDAEKSWADYDGQSVTDKHYCWDHRIPECCGCDETNDLTERDGDRYCPSCLATETKETR